MLNKAICAAVATLVLVCPMVSILSLESLADEDGVSNVKDPREDITSALQLYIRLLEEKQIEQFLETALSPTTLKTYREADQFKTAVSTLSGAQRDLDVYLLRKSLEMKPRLWTTEFLMKERATFEWNDPKHGKVEVDLVKEKGKWYLNW